MRGGVAAPATLILASALMACGAPSLPTWHEEQGYRWRDLRVAGTSPGFTSIASRRSGITFANDVSDSVLLGNRMLGQGAGVALGDVDGDGLVDIFLARTQGSNALYRNRGDWRFEDITARAGVAASDRYSSGAAFADIDGDADLDLILLATTGPNAIFVNDGRGQFTERRDLGLDPTGRGGTTVAMADVEGDGDLDLYVANYKPYSPVDTITPQRRAMSQLVRQTAPGRYEVVPEHQRDFKLVMRPDMGGLNVTMRGEPDDFYVNEGGRFTRASLGLATFREADGNPIAEEAESFTLAARFADLNMDGAPDLYVANDFEDPDELWFNDGQGGFRRAPWTAQRQLSNSSMGLDVADVNGDALPDLFLVDMLSSDSRRLKTQMPTHTPLPKRPGDVRTKLQQQRNTLFINRGDATFSEASLLAGVQASGWSWSTMFLDVDLDGWQDILVANGHLWDVMDSDTQERLQNRLTDVHWQRQRWEFPALPLRNVVFRNRGDMTFEEASETWRFGADADLSHALAAGDLDGDGDLDVVVNRLRSPALVLRNDAPAARVAVRLRGNGPNTNGVGSKVRLLGGAVPVQVREVAAGGLYLSHSDHAVAFAMGTAQRATLMVDWPDGRRTVVEDVRPNRLYEIAADGAALPAAVDSLRDRDSAALFRDATAQLGGHTHTDTYFDDWERQFLLPGSLSQLGPGVAWFDYDRDGDEDLFVGAGRGGRLGVFRNERGRLRHQPSEGIQATSDLTTVLGLGGPGTSRIIAGVSSWEIDPKAGDPVPPAAVGAMVGATGVSGVAAAIVPPRESATGPLALGDVDGDGDLDLFVGGRVRPAAYPQPASSALFRNDGARFSPDTTNAKVLDGVGLVSAALFADIDGDADADLILAREWDSLLLLVNDRGQLRPASSEWGLARWTSRWNGLTSGDLDGDGRLDLIATSWGRNTIAGADSARPLFVVHGAIGSGGEEEMLLARHDARLGGLAPLNSYPRVRVAVRDVARRIGTFAEYADATLDEVLGPLAGSVSRRAITTQDHMVFLNRGDHFVGAALPVESQLAPAFHAGVADLDGDGNEDVFLSQNFFPTAVGMPRYDAGRGLVLAGDGTGRLTPMSGHRSGLVAYGDQRGAAFSDFDRDGRLDIAVAQNGAETRLFQNQGAKPGLRVRVRGPASNPDAIGAQVRLIFGDRAGPVREIHAGSGYWSQNGTVQVFGVPSQPTEAWVRWAGGAVARVPVAAGVREITVTPP